MSLRLDRSRELHFCDVGVEQVDFALHVDGHYERSVSAVAGTGGHIRFPHMWSDAGESLGSEAHDALVREEARTELARFHAYMRARVQRR
jgi:hypothetical protein